MYIVYFGIWKDLVLLKKMLFKDTLFHNLKWQDGWKIKVVWIVQFTILVVFKLSALQNRSYTSNTFISVLFTPLNVSNLTLLIVKP